MIEHLLGMQQILGSACDVKDLCLRPWRIGESRQFWLWWTNALIQHNAASCMLICETFTNLMAIDESITALSHPLSKGVRAVRSLPGLLIQWETSNQPTLLYTGVWSAKRRKWWGEMGAFIGILPAHWCNFWWKWHQGCSRIKKKWFYHRVFVNLCPLNGSWGLTTVVWFFFSSLYPHNISMK